TGQTLTREMKKFAYDLISKGSARPPELLPDISDVDALAASLNLPSGLSVETRSALARIAQEHGNSLVSDVSQRYGKAGLERLARYGTALSREFLNFLLSNRLDLTAEQAYGLQRVYTSLQLSNSQLADAGTLAMHGATPELIMLLANNGLLTKATNLHQDQVTALGGILSSKGTTETMSLINSFGLEEAANGLIGRTMTSITVVKDTEPPQPVDQTRFVVNQPPGDSKPTPIPGNQPLAEVAFDNPSMVFDPSVISTIEQLIASIEDDSMSPIEAAIISQLIENENEKISQTYAEYWEALQRTATPGMLVAIGSERLPWEMVYRKVQERDYYLQKMEELRREVLYKSGEADRLGDALDTTSILTSPIPGVGDFIDVMGGIYNALFYFSKGKDDIGSIYLASLPLSIIPLVSSQLARSIVKPLLRNANDVKLFMKSLDISEKSKLLKQVNINTARLAQSIIDKHGAEALSRLIKIADKRNLNLNQLLDEAPSLFNKHGDSTALGFIENYGENGIKALRNLTPKEALVISKISKDTPGLPKFIGQIASDYSEGRKIELQTIGKYIDDGWKVLRLETTKTFKLDFVISKGGRIEAHQVKSGKLFDTIGGNKVPTKEWNELIDGMPLTVKHAKDTGAAEIVIETEQPVTTAMENELKRFEKDGIRITLRHVFE
ncbi:hypothetical protein HYS54_04935, partial [Candidatus Micrarchaeota archaeon]|nr:hypothetical protein [Candidatus Micrarchaeota archaeon]